MAWVYGLRVRKVMAGDLEVDSHLYIGGVQGNDIGWRQVWVQTGVPNGLVRSDNIITVATTACATGRDVSIWFAEDGRVSAIVMN